MADSIREQIGQALLARVQTITVANGYETDLGLRFTRATKSIDPDDVVARGPTGTFFEGTEERDKRYGAGGRAMSVVFEVYDERRSEKVESQATTVNRMEADLTRALETYDQSLRDLIESLSITAIQPEYAEDGGKMVSLKTAATVVYATKEADPYSQP